MSSKLVSTNAAWSDYLYWQVQDKKTLTRINLLIKNAIRDLEDGIGKPQALKENLSVYAQGVLMMSIDGFTQ